MLSLRSISYPEPPSSMMLPIFLGERQRYPSVTDVLLLERRPTSLLLVVAHRYGAKIYLTEVDLTTHQHRHLFVIKVKHEGAVHYVESMEFDPDQKKLYVICYSEYLLTYRLEIGPTLLFEGIRRMGIGTDGRGEVAIRYHGIKLHHHALYLTPSMSDNDGIPVEILRYDLATRVEEKITGPDLLSNYRIKDMIFVGEDGDRVILVVNYKNKQKKKMTQRGIVFDGFLGLYQWPALRLLHRVEYEHVHFDRGVYDKGDGVFYVTGGDRKGGYFWRGRMVGDELQMMEREEVADFPHGIRVEDVGEERKFIAYTSYGTDSMYYGYMDR
jgi:hypothetical protein